MNDSQIVYNALQTPDGTIIHSRHRHDYVTHIDKNGNEYMIDGGCDYVRRSNWGDEKVITVYDTDPFETVRQFFHWGRNYDKDGNVLPKTEWVPLKEITDDHLDALIEYPKAADWCKKLFRAEKGFRQQLKDMF